MRGRLPETWLWAVTAREKEREIVILLLFLERGGKSLNVDAYGMHQNDTKNAKLLWAIARASIKPKI